MSLKPVKLQVNNSGAWKNVISFDADDDFKVTRVLAAATTLARIGTGVTFRIVTADGLQDVLMIWSAEKGWKAWGHRP